MFKTSMVFDEGVFRQIIEQFPTFILLIDEDLRIVFLNQTQPGFTKEDFLTRDALASVPGFEQEALAQFYRRIFLTGESGEHHLFALTSPGKLGRYRITASRVEISGAFFLLVSSADVTQEWLQQESLNYLWKSSPVMMHILDQRRHIVDVSRGWEEKMGYSREEVIGRSITDYLHAQSARIVERDWEQFIKVSEVKDKARTFRTKSGALVETEFYSSVFRDTRGEVHHIISVFFDVTERNKAARSKSEFLAVMSHELRTPLNGILGLASLLDGHEDVKGEARSMVRHLVGSAAMLRVLIDNVLDYLKIEQGQVLLDIGEFSLVSLVDQCLDLVSDTAEAKGLKLRAGIASDAARFFRGDRTKIIQILTNLLSNAVKFTPQGEVTLSVEHSRGPPEHVSFEVRDTGIGIPPEVLPTLFQHFTQADSSISRRFGGSGLGLAISQKLAELMNGRISVQSEAGKGSVFTVLLPLERVAHRTSFDASALKGKTALVVDPDDDERARLVGLLADLGLRVTARKNGLEALQLWSDEAQPLVDCVFLASEMPVIDGYRLSGLLPRIRSTPDLRVFITGSRAHHHPKADGPLHGFLAKPFRARALFALLRETFDLAGPAPEAEAPAAPLRVLVAEDNKINQMVLAAMLRKLKLTPDLASNGIEALQAAEKANYDLIFMDIHMPEMDGFAATSQLRAREARESGGHRAHIVALTADAFDATKEACLAVGMDGFLRKPVAMENIAELIENLRKHRSAR